MNQNRGPSARTRNKAVPPANLTGATVSSMADFMILSKIGEGAYSDVYKVKRISDSKIYALKKVKMGQLSTKEKENALNEVRILASINHETIIGYKEAFFEDETSCLCLVMDFADDKDLYLKICDHQKGANKPIEERQVWAVFIQLVRALNVLHSKKILHRDLKSANVFLSKQLHARLGDLNVSKVAKKGLLYTQTGTPYYASPEVWQDKPYDSKSDIWSLGCVLYEMCTLKPPFRAQDMNGLYKRVLKGAYPPIDRRNYSSSMSGMIAKLIQVEPKNRPNCKAILEMELIQSKAEEIGIDLSQDLAHVDGSGYVADSLEDVANSKQGLLNTIRVPANLSNLKMKLPKANYNSSTVAESLRSREPLDGGRISPNSNSQKKYNPNAGASGGGGPTKQLKQIKSMKDIIPSPNSNTKVETPTTTHNQRNNIRGSQAVPNLKQRQQQEQQYDLPTHQYNSRNPNYQNDQASRVALSNAGGSVGSSDAKLENRIQQEVQLRRQQKQLANLHERHRNDNTSAPRANINLDSLKLPSVQVSEPGSVRGHGQYTQDRGMNVVQKQRQQLISLQEYDNRQLNRNGSNHQLQPTEKSIVQAAQMQQARLRKQSGPPVLSHDESSMRGPRQDSGYKIRQGRNEPHSLKPPLGGHSVNNAEAYRRLPPTLESIANQEKQGQSLGLPLGRNQERGKERILDPSMRIARLQNNQQLERVESVRNIIDRSDVGSSVPGSGGGIAQRNKYRQDYVQQMRSQPSQDYLSGVGSSVSKKNGPVIATHGIANGRIGKHNNNLW